MAEARLVDALLNNLDAEREALLTGRLGRLGDLAEERERLVTALTQNGAGAEALKRLRGAAERNQGLQEAAAEGIRQAMGRLRSLREAQGPIGSYTETGGAVQIGPDRQSVERKA